MNDSIKRISLDIHSTSSSATVNAKRGDTGRRVIVSLVDGGVPYIISKDCYAVFTAKKPDGKVVYNDCTIENNAIIYAVTEQTVAVEGRADCEIKLYGADGKLITSPKFIINVIGTVYNEGDEIESSDEFNALTRVVAEAQQAMMDANAAVDKAVRASNACMVIGSASGEAIALTDAIEQYFAGFRIFGKTTQDGTPSPDAPVDLVSVGDSGSITVNVNSDNEAQGMTLATPNGLPGIPVTSGGNYTDASGQQWVCDEIDFARGVYVQRVFKFSRAVADMNNSESYPGWRNSGISKYYPNGSGAIGLYGAKSLCNIDSNPSGVVHINTVSTGDILMIPNQAGMTQSAWKAKYPNLVFELLVSIPNPVETPLAEEEIAAFANLHTYRDNTTVSNDASAHMKLEYVMDAKKYIDSIIGSSSVPSAWLANVTLLASAWTGSGNLHSQVVKINGVTPCSKVDLLPSVEQLAIFHTKDVGFVTENDDGVVTVYAIGDKPTMDYTMQVSITEVVV